VIISTIKEKCKQCYACVRNCPVKAVKIEDGQAEIIESRCIECGNCLKVCSQKAKEVLDYRNEVRKMLMEKEPVSLILAPSFVASFELNHPLKVIAALKALGFHDIWPASLGAQIIAPEYEKLVNKNEMTISSACPAIVNLVEKHFPSLLKYLAPIVSPMVATARYIKSIRPQNRIVFAGPCIAKKGEINNSRIIEYVLTFKELKSLLEEKEIIINDLFIENFAGPIPFNGQIIPLSGGLLKMLNIEDDLLDNDYLVVDGEKESLHTLEALAKGNLTAKFIDILMCKGCIDGPVIDCQQGYYNRKKSIVSYFKDIPIKDRLKGRIEIFKILNLELGRDFSDKHIITPEPEEKDIKTILASTGKLTDLDELNCGACGYNSCREKAVAVFKGLAEVEMCLPYLLEKKSSLLEQLAIDFEKINELHRDLDSIIEASYDGICVTDGEGNILKVNKALKYFYDLTEDLIGISAGELERRNLVYPSVTLLVLKEKRSVTFVQHVHNGRKLLATGTPIFNGDGKLVKIITNVRDFEELEKVKNKFDRSFKEKDQLGKNHGTENIIAFSQPMAKVLDTCRKIAKVNSTVLITGESGVGKEVAANYIHSLSERKDGPWIKVNCGSIPENLIESELFGYEAGAFTGAKRGGKKGFFELADKGSIFLDEIGELPLSLQVKLLHVLQEKYIVRIGGLKPIQVDIRIIAATNRNLEEMVKKGMFRQDLFYRLNVVPIEVPPLRKRKEDIIPLLNHFLKLFNTKYDSNKKFSREVLQLFLGYHWPGNVRELVNITERLVVTTEKTLIDKEDLPSFIIDASITHTLEGLPKLQESLDNLEKEILQKALTKYTSSYKIAKALGVNQSTIIRKLKKHGLT